MITDNTAGDGYEHLPSNPETGELAEVADARAAFAEITRRIPRDPEAEYAFIAARIGLVEQRPGLSPEQRARAVAAIRAMLDR